MLFVITFDSYKRKRTSINFFMARTIVHSNKNNERMLLCIIFTTNHEEEDKTRVISCANHKNTHETEMVLPKWSKL
jgi:hypothetical protein